MLSGIGLLLFTALLWVAVGAIQGYAGKNKLNLLLMQALSAIGSIVVWGSVCFFTGGWQNVHLVVLIAAPLAGAINIFTMVLMAKSMQYGPNGLVWAMIQSALIMPFAMGVFFFDVPSPAVRLAGVFTIIASMLLMGWFGRENKFAGGSCKWLFFTFASFLTAGLGQCAANLPSYFLAADGGSAGSLTMRMTLASLGALAVFLLSCIGRKGAFADAGKCIKPALLLLLTSVSGLSLYGGLDLLARCNAGAVGYPLTLGSSNILFLLFAIIFLKERPCKAAIFSLLAGVAGIGMMIVPSEKTTQGNIKMSSNNRTIIASPINFVTKTYNREKVVENLRKAGCRRVYLCCGAMSYDVEKQRKLYEKLGEEVKFFKSQGFEVWYWRWALCLSGDNPFTRAVSIRATSKNEICPLDPGFQAYAANDLQMIARAGVDGILYDDDFRFNNGTIGLGCFCPRHLEKVEALYGQKFDTSDLKAFEKKYFFSAPNKLRNVMLKVWGESLEAFARISREAVDKVNPGIRMGMCACLTSYDADGTTPARLAKILAGPRHTPYVRLIGAPYWVSHWGFRIRLNEIIEYERMQAAWLPEEFEIFAEGDAWPRPRFATPAAHLEVFDSALRFADGLDGIQKYMFDYTASAGYETGYLDMHLDNKKLYEFCEDAAAGKTNTGIRVWQEKHTFADADLSDIPDQRQYIDGPMMYSQAAWALAAHGIPSVHQGSGCAAIVFGESARTLPEEFKKRPLILDIQAARILAERNWQVGLTGSGERIQPGSESFRDGEIVQILNRWPGSRKITVDKNAEIWSEFSNMDTPASYKYFAPDGGKYLVLNFEATISHESSYRNYRFSESIRRFLSDCQVKLPAVVVSKNPDIYMQCKDDAAGRAIGIWNCSADYSKNVVIELDGEFKNAEFAGIKGSLQGNKIIIELIEAFRFGFIKLSR